jgi:hypothetical protein
MKQIKDVSKHELLFQLRKLQAIAHEVAYATNEADSEYFTVRYLRPELERVEQLLKNETSKAE